MTARKVSLFTRFARKASVLTGRPSTFVLAAAIIIVWAVSGPMFGFSDTLQLVINTGTTIVTFLMVFLIQNTQNRDTEALQVKLDELIRAMRSARNEILDLEEMDDKDLNQVREEYLALAEHARMHLENKDPHRRTRMSKKNGKDRSGPDAS